MARNLFKRGFIDVEEKKLTVCMNNHIQFMLPLTVGIDCAGSPVALTCGVSGDTSRMRGCRCVFMIYNKTGASDYYAYTLKNLTKVTTLLAGNVTLVNNEFSCITQIYNNEKVSNGDYIEFEVNDGIIGTAGGSVSFGYIDFEVETLEDYRNGIQ